MIESNPSSQATLVTSNMVDFWLKDDFCIIKRQSVTRITPTTVIWTFIFFMGTRTERELQ